MSDVLDAFEVTLDAQEAFVGERLKATVGSVTNQDALVGEITRDALAVAGGRADTGGFTLQMLRSLFPATREALDTFMDALPIAIAKGAMHRVLSHVEDNGILILTCGDPAEEVT